MRQALNEVVTNRRFLVRKSVTPLEVAEHILQQAASGERELNRLKSSAFEKLSTDARSEGANGHPLSPHLADIFAAPRYPLSEASGCRSCSLS